jgi:hypothetical protein
MAAQQGRNPGSALLISGFCISFFSLMIAMKPVVTSLLLLSGVALVIIGFILLRKNAGKG